MKIKKSIAIDESLMQEIAEIAAKESRSANGQIIYLLTIALDLIVNRKLKD